MFYIFIKYVSTLEFGPTWHAVLLFWSFFKDPDGLTTQDSFYLVFYCILLTKKQPQVGLNSFNMVKLMGH